MSEHQFDTTMGAAAEAYLRLDGCRLAGLEKLADLDSSGAYVRDGFTSATAFLMHRCGMGAGDANREVFLARSLHQMPYAHKQAGAGQVTVAQLEALAHAQRRRPDRYGLDEQTLVDSVTGLMLSDTRRVVEYWCQAHDQPPVGDEDIEPSRLYSSKTLGGRGRLDGDLDAETHDLVETALDRLMTEMVRHTPREDLASRPAMRAEALGEMARRFLDARDTPTDHGNRPHLTVVVNWEVLTGGTRHGVSELWNTGIVVSPETAQRLACDASVCRLLTGPDSEILDLGRSRRTVSPAQWKALRVRDRHCQFRGCGRPWSWCDAHHLDPWTQGGETNHGRLVLLCRAHHVLIHEGGWKLQGEPGHLTLTRPDGTQLPHGPP